MRIAVLEIELRAPWVHTLKEKRMVVQSLLARLRRKFNVSACETAEQDVHQTIVLGVAAVAADAAQGDSILDTVLSFVESATDAQVVSVEREFR